MPVPGHTVSPISDKTHSLADSCVSWCTDKMTPVRSRPGVVIASYPVLLLSIILSTLTSVCHHSCLAWHVVTHMVSGGNTAAQVGLALSNTFSHLGTEPSSTCRGAPAPPWPRWPAPCTDSLWGDVSLHCSEYLQHPLVLWEHSWVKYLQRVELVLTHTRNKDRDQPHHHHHEDPRLHHH